MTEDEIIVDYLIGMMVFHSGMPMDEEVAGRYVWEGLYDASRMSHGMRAYYIPECLK